MSYPPNHIPEARDGVEGLLSQIAATLGEVAETGSVEDRLARIATALQGLDGDGDVGSAQELFISSDATSDGNGSSGSPRKASTAAELDAILRPLWLADTTDLVVRFYPGDYFSYGPGDIPADWSTDGTFGWAMGQGWKIIGDGPGAVTITKASVSGGAVISLGNLANNNCAIIGLKLDANQPTLGSSLDISGIGGQVSRNCIFHNLEILNHGTDAVDGAAGIYLQNNSATAGLVTIDQVYIHDPAGEAIGIVFSSNNSTAGDTGIYGRTTSGTLSRLLIIGNGATGAGARHGIDLYGVSNLTLRDFVVRNCGTGVWNDVGFNRNVHIHSFTISGCDKGMQIGGGETRQWEQLNISDGTITIPSTNAGIDLQGSVYNSSIKDIRMLLESGSAGTGIRVTGTTYAGNSLEEIKSDVGLVHSLLDNFAGTAETHAERYDLLVAAAGGTTVEKRKTQQVEMARRVAAILNETIDFDFIDWQGNVGTGATGYSFKGRVVTLNNHTWSASGVTFAQSGEAMVAFIPNGTGFYAYTVHNQPNVKDSRVYHHEAQAIDVYDNRSTTELAAGAATYSITLPPNRVESFGFRYGPTAIAFSRNGVQLSTGAGATLTAGTNTLHLYYSNNPDYGLVARFSLWTAAEITAAQDSAINDAYADIFGGVSRSTGAAGDITAAYAAGTAYALTNTAAALDFGTTDPAIVLPVSGRYRISGQVSLAYAAATVVAETATLKFRRTNNTAADLTNGTTGAIDLPTSTVVTNTYGLVPIPEVVYDGVAGDALTIFGNVSAALGAGSIDAAGANIVATLLSP